MADFKVGLSLTVEDAQRFQQGLNSATAALSQIRDAFSKGIGPVNVPNIAGNLGQQATEGAQALGGMNVAAAALRSTLIGLAASVVAGLGFAKIIQEGIQFNQTIETARLGISALVSAQADITNAQGEALKGTDKLAAGAVIADEQLQKLRVAGLRTTATFQQLAEAFQIAVGTGLGAGLNLDQIRELTIGITQAAGALGVPYQQLNQEIRDILQGTIDNNSQVGRALGLSTELLSTWKAQGTTVENLTKLLKPFGDAGEQIARTFSGAASNLQEALQTLAGSVTAGLFDQLRRGFLEATQGLFNFDTGGVSEQIQPLVSLFQDAFTGIGFVVRSVIVEIRDVALAISQFIANNQGAFDRITDAVAAFGLAIGEAVTGVIDLVGSLFQVSGSAGGFDLIATALESVNLLIAGARDGISLLGVGFNTVAGLILKAVQGIAIGVGGLVSVFSEDLGDSIFAAADNIGQLGDAALGMASDTVAAFGRGESAVASYGRRLAEAKAESQGFGGSFGDFSQALAEIADKGNVTAESLRKLGIEGTNAVNNVKAVGDAAQASFSAGKLSAEELIQVQQALSNEFTVARVAAVQVEASMKSLGVVAAGQASESVNKVTKAFKDLAAVATATQAQLDAGAIKLIDSVKTKADFDAVIQAMQSLEPAGREVSDNVKARFDDLGRSIEALGPGIETAVGQSLERLGVKTEQQLEAIAEQASVDFQRALSAGVDFKQQEAAFNKYAAASATANNGVVQDFIRAEASAKGFRLTVQDASIDFGDVAARAKSAGDQIKQAFAGAVSSASTVAELAALKAGLSGLAESGRLTGNQLAQSFDAVDVKLRQVAAEPVGALANAFQRFGLQSAEQIRASARQMEADFNQLAASGQVTSQGLEEAFRRYAAASLEANNGVISAQLAATASTRGMGDVLDEVAAKYQSFAQQATVAVIGVSAAMQQTQVDSANVAAGIQALVAATKQVISSVTDLGAAATNALANQFPTALDPAKSGVDALRASLTQVTTEIEHNRMVIGERWPLGELSRINEAANQIKQQFFGQAIAAQEFQDQLTAAAEVGGARLRDLVNSANTVTSQFSLLDQQQLNNLQSAIDDARGKVQQLDAQIQGTIGSIRSIGDNLNEELLRAQGKLKEIEQARAQAQRAELQQKLAQVTADPGATAAQKTAAQQEFNRSINLLNQVSQLKIADAAKQEADTRSRAEKLHQEELARVAQVGAAKRAANDSVISSAAGAGAPVPARAEAFAPVAAAQPAAAGRAVTFDVKVDAQSLLTGDAMRRTFLPLYNDFLRSTA
jgi:hypothetical protein